MTRILRYSYNTDALSSRQGACADLSMVCYTTINLHTVFLFNIMKHYFNKRMLYYTFYTCMHTHIESQFTHKVSQILRILQVILYKYLKYYLTIREVYSGRLITISNFLLLIPHCPSRFPRTPGDGRTGAGCSRAIERHNPTNRTIVPPHEFRTNFGRGAGSIHAGMYDYTSKIVLKHCYIIKYVPRETIPNYFFLSRLINRK